jgi:hypothetical protein
MTEYRNRPRQVPTEKASYFFSDIGNYTGHNAVSLKEFARKIKELNEKSLEFHLRQGDFENWMNGVLRDEELARQVKELGNKNLAGENLRDPLSSIISKRLEQSTVTRAAQRIYNMRMQTSWKRNQSGEA